VCYRVNGSGIEFLLVRTRGDRWTFPKGGLEPGLTHAQTAALEAFEEAGVHGRIEEAAFARYTGRKREGRQRSSTTELAVSAHLCQVLWLGPARESKRSPTWFPAEKAKRRLQEDRTPEDGTEIARVVDRAVSRIQRLRHAASTTTDALQRVQFEAAPATGVLRRIQRVSFASLPPASKLKLLPKNVARQTGQPE
jgi:8-oxo-dGTP pyrophosphatase MutT (NUDIX family)